MIGWQQVEKQERKASEMENQKLYDRIILKQQIDKGWSKDKKYCVTTEDGRKYFLRITPELDETKYEEMFYFQKKVHSFGVPTVEPVEFGRCGEGTYILETWTDGEDAEAVIPRLADSRQYALGLEAGKYLKKIHQIPAPENQQDWESRFNAKIDRKMRMYQECPVPFDGAEKCIDYINENRHLLAGRPQTFQHGDYHIGNMLVADGALVVIDFDRYDFGDPWEEFNRIVWCAQAAPVFASGIVNGYFDGAVPSEFWELLALYICSNTLSSVCWAVPFGEGEIQKMLGQAKDVLAWYDNMKNPVPSWYFPGYYLQYIDGIPYKMKGFFDFGFISRYGKVFEVFDDQNSGNICFGTEKDGEKYFVKFAGAPTEAYDGTSEDAIRWLKSTLPVYQDLEHKNLIRFVSSEEVGGGFAMTFQWMEGFCMGRMYPESHQKFMQMPVEDKLIVFRDILDFLDYVAASGYVAIDFYDGSVLYDDRQQKTTICDVDFFRKMPCKNDMGRMWGSSRFQSPEEFTRGADIDEVTNVYTAGAFAFALFGGYERTLEKWSLSEALFRVVAKATADDRSKRQQSIHQLREEWGSAMI